MNMIPNRPVTMEDTKNTESIWGPVLGRIEGKTAHKALTKVRIDNTSIPISIMKQYKNGTLSLNITKATGISF